MLLGGTRTPPPPPPQQCGYTYYGVCNIEVIWEHSTASDVTQVALRGGGLNGPHVPVKVKVRPQTSYSKFLCSGFACHTI